jgi:Protein of unknown function (DUF3551)
MRQFLKMTAAPTTAMLALGFLAFASATTPAAAGEYCRKDVSSAMTSCGFDTMAQCEAMSSGRGGGCFRDPFLPEKNANAFAYAPKALHSKHVPHRAGTNAR